ncbi:transcription elongation factor GreA [bacterium]|nr:transcription elongation factor GreA [bacterium]NUN47126.1 transcription elongation factor GreA [bacterium]HMW33223.1 transcription elongation factor GreA [bacterium]HMW35535.1 transcription elongation factor GreA [bacterium]HMY34566.1 transcription elongation factor GreA [bacterium]
MSKFYVTHEGLLKLKEEIQHLKNVKRPEIANRVQVAREHGDLKENAEYHAAKEELQLLQSKINEMEMKVMNAVIVKEDEIPTDKVYILATVDLQNVKTKEKLTYTLVPDNEADWENNKLSVNTPIAKGLLGKKVGDVAKVKIPAGELELKIIKISR